MPSKSKKPDAVWLLSKASPLPGGERRLTPVTVFATAAKAKKWAEERMREIEQSADDGLAQVSFTWPPNTSTGAMPGEQRCLVWDPPTYIAGVARHAPPITGEYVIIPLPVKPKLGPRWREYWAERVLILEQKGAPAREVAEADKILKYTRENNL